MTKSITSEKSLFAEVFVEFNSATLLDGLVGRRRDLCHRHATRFPTRVSLVAWSLIRWIAANDQWNLKFEISEQSFRFELQLQIVVQIDVHDGARVFTGVAEGRSDARGNGEGTRRFDQCLVIVDELRNGKTHQFQSTTTLFDLVTLNETDVDVFDGESTGILNAQGQTGLFAGHHTRARKKTFDRHIFVFSTEFHCTLGIADAQQIHSRINANRIAMIVIGVIPLLLDQNLFRAFEGEKGNRLVHSYLQLITNVGIIFRMDGRG